MCQLHCARVRDNKAPRASPACIRMIDVHLLPLCRDVQHIVTANETVTVLILQLAALVLFRLLHGNVHEAIETREHTAVLNTGVQLHDDWPTKHGLQKVGG